MAAILSQCVNQQYHRVLFDSAGPLSYTTWFTLGLAASAVYKQFLLWLNPTLFPQVDTKFHHMNNTIYWQEYEIDGLVVQDCGTPVC